jgi:protein tyrosine phosphatase (PTP) superfamily phosphohydrolase (DUF442 family)
VWATTVSHPEGGPRVKRIYLLGVSLIAAAMLSASPNPPAFPCVETKALPNAHVVTKDLISGAQPEGEQGFKDLAALGVKTIVSVDGQKPDVETARQYGLRYVHLPITYSGVTADEGQRIAKALTELDGPIYLHCHHGKHRSAAAVAVACVLNGSLKPEQAESVLKTFGTGENYKGLWQAARDARPMDSAALAKVKVNYVEQAEIPALAERMIEIDHRWDSIKSLQKNGWKGPGVDPADEALQLQEHFRETGRGDDISSRPAAFHKLLGDGESSADSLQRALSANPLDIQKADAAFKQLANSCAACHKSYRD